MMALRNYKLALLQLSDTLTDNEDRHLVSIRFLRD